MLFRPASFLYITLAILFLGGAAGCQGEHIKRLETRDLLLEITGGQAGISAEIARTGEERAQGLMYRETLADGEGMLFVFDRDQILSFWMKNTLIPLSVAFIAHDGTIREIHDMQPQDLSGVSSSRSLRYALEVPQGWFDRAGIKVGDRLLLPEDF
ncbi:MAG: DUF192 domain-containing protein [Treponema sp.]|jgi:uncharacterized membrane protein (UPF0127 family)|nr:DUF192 domain-containing protein [Treponema sp.]